MKILRIHDRQHKMLRDTVAGLFYILHPLSRMIITYKKYEISTQYQPFLEQVAFEIHRKRRKTYLDVETL